MYNLSEWHRGTRTVPPVGAVNVPPENPKNQENSCFWSFLGHFFLINYIGFWWFSKNFRVYQIFKIDFLVDQKIFFVQNFAFDLIYVSSVTENHLEHRQVKSHTRVTQSLKKSVFFVLIDIFWPPTWWILCTVEETNTSIMFLQSSVLRLGI